MPPYSVCRGRNGILYGVNGAERGFRYHPTFGKQPIGMTAPSSAPLVTASGSSSAGLVVTAVTPVNSAGEPSSYFWQVPIRFKYAPTLESVGGGGTGADLMATAAPSLRVSDIFVISGGQGYSSPPAIKITTPFGKTGSGAKADAIVVDGSVVAAFITSPGADYNADPTVSVTPNEIASTAKANGILRAGYLAGAEITDTGAQFGTAPSFKISYKSDADASFSAVLDNGFVHSVTVTNGGTGYTAATVSFSGGGASRQAAGTATVSGGAVTGVSLTDVGNGYTSAPTITISGDGSGASATPVVYYGLTLSVTSAGDSYASGNFATDASPTQTLSFSGHSGPGPQSYSGFAHYSTQFVTNQTGGILSVRTQAHRFTSVPTKITVNRIQSPLITPYSKSAPMNSAGVEMDQAFSGRYLCCYRFVDSTAPSLGGPVSSDPSPFTEVETGGGASELSWVVSKADADARATHVELWRTTSDQALTLFRVASIPLSQFSSATHTHSDTVSDFALARESRPGFASMPIILPSGQVNARRFGIPPQNMSVLCQFQDRMWYACDATKAKPNSLYFSEIDEPESVPQVNEIVVQENSRATDAVVALVPFGSAMLVAQRNHLYRMQYNALPVIDAQISVIAARGALNDRCWDTFGDLAAIADDSGIYLVSGGSIDTISDPVRNYWEDGIIDLSKSDLFSLVYDTTQAVLRFYFCTASDPGPAPQSALCFSIVTRAWWVETYPHSVGATCNVTSGNSTKMVCATYDGTILRPSGASDRGAAVPYQLRTGSFSLNNDTDRSVRLVYSPTAGQESLLIGACFNNSSTARPNAIAIGDYGQFQVAQGGLASIDLSVARSALGSSSGHARLRLSGRLDDNSVGADRHVAVQLSGSQTSHRVAIHGLAIGGVE